MKKVKYKINRARTKGELLGDHFKLSNNDFEKVMRYYGEDPTDVESKSVFFQTFVEFSTLFKKCAKENMEREEAERVYAQRKKIMEASTRKDSDVDSGTDNIDGENTAVDSLLAQLRGVDKKPEPLRTRKSVKVVTIKSGESLPVPDEEKENKTVTGDEKLLERTQAMLNDIQNI